MNCKVICPDASGIMVIRCSYIEFLLKLFAMLTNKYLSVTLKKRSGGENPQEHPQETSAGASCAGCQKRLANLGLHIRRVHPKGFQNITNICIPQKGIYTQSAATCGKLIRKKRCETSGFWDSPKESDNSVCMWLVSMCPKLFGHVTSKSSLVGMIIRLNYIN